MNENNDKDKKIAYIGEGYMRKMKNVYLDTFKKILINLINLLMI